MKNILGLFIIGVMVLCLGCSTAHKAAKTGGTYIGKGAHVTGGLYEGIADGIRGPVTDEENPYNR